MAQPTLGRAETAWRSASRMGRARMLCKEFEMSEYTALTAQPRARAGKGVARATRRENRVPAII